MSSFFRRNTINSSFTIALTNLTFDSTSYEKQLIAQDTTDLEEKRKRWHESLSKDVYIEEALNVLEDLKTAYPIKKVASTVQK